MRKGKYDFSKGRYGAFGATGGFGFSMLDFDNFDRLPPHYQYFMRKLLELFPDLDLSSLLLPYACYKDGELYYKFIENKYFCSTYSHV